MSQPVLWYGERGIVNAVVTELTRDSDRLVPLGKSLLECIDWTDGPPSWISEITDITYIVELGLAHFGDPDLIVVCRVPDGTRVVFVEVKAFPYLDCAMSNEKGMATSGFNSSINGQLSLKYRFSKALESWSGDGTLVEPAPLFAQYRKSSDGLSDPRTQPRRLAKWVILRKFVADFAGMPAEHFYFVAWTWDRSPFFDQQGYTSDVAPRFLDEKGSRIAENRLGWLGYQKLEKKLDSGTAFRAAVRSMHPDTQLLQPAKPLTPSGDLPTIRFKALDSYHKETQERLEKLTAAAGSAVDSAKVQRLKGSTSIRLNGRVRVKLFPQVEGDNEVIILAASRPSDMEEGSRLKGMKVGSRGSVFWGTKLPTDLNEAVEKVQSLAQSIEPDS